MPVSIYMEAGIMADQLDLGLSDEEAGVMVYATKEDEGKSVEMRPVLEGGEIGQPLVTRIIAAHHEHESDEVTYPALLAPVPPGKYQIHLAGHAPREVILSPGVAEQVRW
jgi:hypothetical protein